MSGEPTTAVCAHPRPFFVVEIIVCGRCGEHLPRCPMLSSVTEKQCVLPDGHPMDSAVRFHRFLSSERQP